MLFVLVSILCFCTYNEKITRGTDGKLKFNEKLELTIWETQGTDYTPSEQPEQNVVTEWLIKETNTEVINMKKN